MKQKLFLDMDSTFVDSIAAYCTTYNNLYYLTDKFVFANPDKVNQWDLKDQCPLESKPMNIFGSKYFFYELDFMPDAFRVITKLSEKYEVIVCSIGTYDNLQHKSKWLNNNLPFVDAVLIKNKGVEMNKSVVDMSGAIFIDDHMSNLVSSNAATRICFGKKYVWNEKWDGIWASNWKEIEETLL